ncbi:MAG: VCBS repeat-containing protein [Planctomycetes bacterium]|nr:VCBS repeat-containing protein [Planctomycetota bacterium]
MFASLRSILALGLWATAGVPSVGLAQRPSFEETRRGLPILRESVPAATSGDIDGDGLADLILGTASGRAELWTGRAGGELRRHPIAIAPLGLRVRATQLADLDADGDLDLLVAQDTLECASNSSSCVGGLDRAWRNEGAGAFTEITARIPTDDQTRTNSIATGDLDGDGDIDLIYGVSPHIWYPSPAQPPRIERAQDLLFVNLGGASFVDATASLPSAMDDTRIVRLLDVDRDGDLDLFKAIAPFSSVLDGQDRIYLNDGSGRFRELVGALPREQAEPLRAAVFDADGDGDVDIAVLESTGIRLHMSFGDGRFWDGSPNIAQWPGDATDLLVADWDRDGDSDLAYLRSGGEFGVLRNDGTGRFARETATIRQVGGTSGVIFDSQLDGDPDLVVFATGAEARLLWNDGRGVLNDVSARDVPIPFPALTCAAGDLDGDGHAEAVLAPTAGGAFAVLRRDAEDRLVSIPAGSLTTDFGAAADLALADLDGDGDLDAVQANVLAAPPWNRPSQIHRNAGGVFSVLPNALPADLDAHAVATGDLNGDGALDLGFVTRNGTARVFLRQGAGYQEQSNALPGMSSSRDLCLADVDGDGVLDAVLAGASTGSKRVLLGDGSGRFRERIGAFFPDHRDTFFSVACGDVDSDGDVDAVFGGGNRSTPQPNRLYLNDGNGFFAEARTIDWPTDRAYTTQIAMVDLDGDRDLDVVCANHLGLERTQVYRNDGAGRFLVDRDALVGCDRAVRAAAAADWDGDGDIDLLLVGDGAPRVQANHSLQLQWRSSPGIGRPLVFDIDGAIGAPFALGCSPGLAMPPFAIPGIGELRLAPASFAWIASGALDASGTGSLALSVPFSPALLGAPIYWQALLGNPLRLTNLEVTRLRWL